MAVTPNAVDAYVHYLRTKLGRRRDRRSRPSAASATGSPMAEGAPARARDDGAEHAALDDEARLLQRDPLRLVAWSGITTLVVLLLLGVALYAAVADSLETASVEQLEHRVDAGRARSSRAPTARRRADPGVRARRRQHVAVPVRRAGPRSCQDRRPRCIDPDGLPEPAALEAARVDGEDIRTSAARDPDAPGCRRRPDPRADRAPRRAAGRQPYVVQALQDRTAEVQTLNSLLAVLVVGGVLVVVVAVGLGRCTPAAPSCRSGSRSPPSAPPCAASASSPPTRATSCGRRSRSSARASSTSRRHPDQPVSASAEALDDIDAEVTHLTALVDDLLLLARSDSGAVALERQPLDLGDVAADAASSLGRPRRRGVCSVVVDPEPAMVIGDPLRLRQLVTILVDNAVRHSPRDGTVTVSVRAPGTVAAVEVEDEGPGIRPEDLPHVFDRFWRAPGAPSGGTGLGLAIAKWIVEQHGGRIGVANLPDGGAAFRAELPTPPMVPAAQATAPA